MATKPNTTQNSDQISDMIVDFVQDFDPSSLDAPASLLEAAKEHVGDMSRQAGSNSVAGFGEVLAKAGRMQALIKEMDEAMVKGDRELMQDLSVRISELVDTKALDDESQNGSFGLF